MNRDHVIFHLREAREELERTIAKIEAEPDYDVGELLVAMMHVYHHLNTAWNGRDASIQRAIACSDEDFAEWRRFPVDIDLSA
jgi:hypothetical protein